MDVTNPETTVRRPSDFDEFALAAWSRLRWAGIMLTGDEHLAEDLAQLALERTYAAWSRVRRAEAFAYARRVLVNANTDRLRRMRLQEASTADLPETVTVADTDAVDDADLLVRLLGELTDRERRVLVLRHYFDLTEPMVAEELGITVGTVKSTASRAFAKLRDRHPGLAGLKG
jgi:RNA polymerase sigma-70 factor (sigma-E family)